MFQDTPLNPKLGFQSFVVGVAEVKRFKMELESFLKHPRNEIEHRSRKILNFLNRSWSRQFKTARVGVGVRVLKIWIGKIGNGIRKYSFDSTTFLTMVTWIETESSIKVDIALPLLYKPGAGGRNASQVSKMLAKLRFFGPWQEIILGKIRIFRAASRNYLG